MLANSRTENSIEFESVTAGYRKGVPVLQGLSFTISTPGLYRVAGSNGSGKSTLLELVSGFLRPWEGAVRLCGVEADASEARHLRSVCRTNPALYPSMTVRDHLAFAARSRHIAPASVVSRLDAYGLQDWAEQPASALSTGNIRKLWLLMCTAANTPIVAIDEPFNGMDAQGVDALKAELSEWAQERIVILVSHSVPEGLPISHSFLFTRTTDSGDLPTLRRVPSPLR